MLAATTYIEQANAAEKLEYDVYRFDIVENVLTAMLDC